MRIIRGKYGRRRFYVPPGITARPTTDFARENLFNVLENMVDFEGLAALDLFAGTGAISFELLSRGCREVTSVERAQTQLQFIRRVSSTLGCEGHRILRADVMKFLRSGTAPRDLVFADPPYDMPDFELVPELVMSSGAVAPGGIFVLEHSAKRDFSTLPGFIERRAYGSVNFSIFRAPES